ncbi:MAG: undecaprenyldiphospho-muramoylpentapeptide beta-N-acetylglucosaminyltransferase [Candidatus Omnitrophica bacterium]|nr:undecaprenyldiphospho-muramoylpentapeptide beta-N-acetylglucosaminyltransferase [Candidatus Omnitrophota bacterium]MDD5237683.1 undecaprenyldiphospho-muramoylpentapeptide beta-N-acetylglucosaminyltransferase [Candidatus Omnitrophota bacterium]
MSRLKVLVATGSSGGHIFPALSFLHTLRDKYKNVDTLLILPKRAREFNLVPRDCKVSYLSISTIKFKLSLKNLAACFGFLKGSLESLYLLVEFRPDVVVGFGSLSCIPVVLLAWIFRIKTLIHEQNVIPGRANRLLAKFADKIAVSFIQTKNYLNSSQKLVFTGNPIRQELKAAKDLRQEALDFFGFDNNKFTILVMGGSQGSHRINTCFLNAVSMMTDKSGFQIVHLAGQADYGLLDSGYRDSQVAFKLFTFLKEMQYAYSIADLAITRAGATTIAELAFFGTPAIIIPYPFAYRHQLNNAGVLTGHAAAILINEDELEPKVLKEVLVDLMNNPNKIKLMRSNFNRISKTNACDLLINEALSLIAA